MVVIIISLLRGGAVPLLRFSVFCPLFRTGHMDGQGQKKFLEGDMILDFEGGEKHRRRGRVDNCEKGWATVKMQIPI